MERLEGGYLGAKPTWSTAASPGVWTLEQVLARRAAGTWPATSFLFDPYFESVSLLLHMDGSNGSTTFVDSSLGNLAVTANGNAQISTAQSKFGGSSGAFDGTGDFLTFSSSTGFNLGSGDFTIELWAYFTSSADASGDALIVAGDSTTNRPFGFYRTQTGIGFWLSTGGANYTEFSVATTINQGQWYHFAATRTNNNVYVFVNGVLVITTAYSGTVANYTGSVYIGRFTWNPAGDLPGYIDEVRITRGVARYTANFAVPGNAGSDEGAALYDPYFDYVSLLLRCNGENNSTTFTDSSNNATTITRGGGAVISTAASRFGGASVYFNGTNDSLSFPDPALGTSDFTIEMWFKTTSSVQYAQFIGNEGTSIGYTLLFNNTSATAGNIALYVSGPGLVCQTSGTSYRDDRWHHLALTRSGNNFTIWVDGVSAGTGTSTASFSGQTNYVGRNNFYTPRNLIGYIDDLRITKGVCRYTTAFRPVGPYATSGKLVDPYLTSTSLLLPMTGDNGTTSFFDRSNNFLRATENGNAKVSTAISKFGAGAAYFDGNNDYLSVASQSNLAFGTGDFTIEFWMYRSGQAVTGNATLIDFRTAEPSTQVMLEAGAAANSNLLQLYVNGAYRITGPTIPVNTWIHVALSRSAGSTRLFVDGYQVGSAYADTNNYSATACVIAGRFAATSGDYRSFNGYLDDLRISTGTARYTSAFTPPERAFNDEAFNDPHYNAVSLLLHMDGANNSTTFTDSSVNGLTVTANGDAKISTVQSRFGGASAVFDGTGDYITVPSGFAFGTSSFTVELWVYWNVAPTATTEYRLWWTSNRSTGIARLDLYAYNSILYAGWSGTNVLDSGALSWSTGRWYHIALVRNGSSWAVYRDGVSVATATNSTTLVASASKVIGENVNGYIDEVRVTEGVARYTSNFTPPTLPFYNTTIPTVDSSFSSVSLLLHMNGTNGSTTFTDSSSNALAVTANGNAQISTAQSKFGGASALFDGTGDRLVVSSSVNLDFGTGDFTIELWVYHLAITKNKFYVSAEGSGGLFFGIGDATDGASSHLSIGWGRAGVAWDGSATHGMSINSWNHVALCRQGANMRMFVNGSQVGSTVTNSTSYNASLTALNIGSQGANYYINAYIDDLRITKGVARYTSNFYIPRAAFPDA